MREGVTFLNFDDTLKQQHLHAGLPVEWIDCTDIPGTYGYCDPFALRELRRRLRQRKYRGVTFIGSGNYHYVTWLLLSEIGQPFALVLFDHHTDLDGSAFHAASDARASKGLALSCGNWVSAALHQLPLLRKVVIVGARLPSAGSAGRCTRAARDERSSRLASDDHEPRAANDDHDLHPARGENGSPAPSDDHGLRLTCDDYGSRAASGDHGPRANAMEMTGLDLASVLLIPEHELPEDRAGLDAVLRRVEPFLGDLPVYISIDKDVLSPVEAMTNWDAGSMPLAHLEVWLHELIGRHRVIGIDICGELPVTPVELLNPAIVRQVRKNERANQAILHALDVG